MRPAGTQVLFTTSIVTRPPSHGKLEDMSIIADTIRDLLSQRDPDKTICPSEVARALRDDDWRDLMDPVRAEAAALADVGVIDITQKARPWTRITTLGRFVCAAGRSGMGDSFVTSVGSTNFSTVSGDTL